MVFNDPFNITGYIRPSYQQAEMNDDMMKDPLELSQDPDLNPQPLVHEAIMLPLPTLAVIHLWQIGGAWGRGQHLPHQFFRLSQKEALL